MRTGTDRTGPDRPVEHVRSFCTAVGFRLHIVLGIFGVGLHGFSPVGSTSIFRGCFGIPVINADV
jgi:hypothetical protein